MAKQTSLFLTKTVKNGSTTIINSDGTTAKNIITAGSDDTLIKGLLITSDDTTARSLQLEIYDGTNARVFGTDS